MFFRQIATVVSLQQMTQKQKSICPKYLSFKANFTHLIYSVGAVTCWFCWNFFHSAQYHTEVASQRCTIIPHLLKGTVWNLLAVKQTSNSERDVQKKEMFKCNVQMTISFFHSNDKINKILSWCVLFLIGSAVILKAKMTKKTYCRNMGLYCFCIMLKINLLTTEVPDYHPFIG